MTQEDKDKILKDAMAIAEDHLKNCEDHDILVDYSIRYGLGKAIEKHRGSPVNFSRDTTDPDMWDLINDYHIHYKAELVPPSK